MIAHLDVVDPLQRPRERVWLAAKIVQQVDMQAGAAPADRAGEIDIGGEVQIVQGAYAARRATLGHVDDVEFIARRQDDRRCDFRARRAGLRHGEQ